MKKRNRAKKYLKGALTLMLSVSISAFGLSLPASAAKGDYSDTLNNYYFLGGQWSENDGVIRGSGNGDCFAMTETNESDFIFETTVDIESGNAASLIFRSNYSGSEAYVANVDLGQRNARIFKFTTRGAITIGSYMLPDPTQTHFTLRVEALGTRLRFFLDGELIISCEDSEFTAGRLGLLLCNATVRFSNVGYNLLDSGANRLNSLSLDGAELYPAFSSDRLDYSLTVPFETEKIGLSAEGSDGTQLYVSAFSKKEGQTLDNTELLPGTEVPLSEGKNTILIETKNSGMRGITTVIDVKRKTNPEDYYNEKYRPQYHVTPEEGWLNDPNGMVYFGGKYHLFYQYFPDSKFPADIKHWAHVESEDMVHWIEKPVAISPDEYGSIWSGSAVVDFNNSTGLFDDADGQTGLVAFYTSFGPAQRQCMAYSLDEGTTWIKYNNGEPIIDTADDPLNDGAFRDPKVFWHEESGRWMMVVAGGPLRFYSSADLINWKPEGMQNEIHTECPDFFELAIDGNPDNTKWVLSGGGVWYMLGDFRQVDGVWKFIPDTGERINFNFGTDVYAGQTFSDIPGRRIMMQWMVNVGYAFDTGNITDPWNGAMSLPYEISLESVDGKLVMMQKPIPEMDSLRGDEYSFENKLVDETAGNLLEGIEGDCYEIRAVISIGNAEEIGFNLRCGENQYTTVKYISKGGLLTVDRTNSGVKIVDWAPMSFTTESGLSNGKLELVMYVDRSSLEVFANDGRNLATTLIYPDSDSTGMEFYVKGGKALVEKLTVYSLDSIYRAEPEVLLKGDINLDGEVNVSDVVMLRQGIMDGSADKTVCDITDDGNVDVSDVVALRKQIMEQN